MLNRLEELKHWRDRITGTHINISADDLLLLYDLLPLIDSAIQQIEQPAPDEIQQAIEYFNEMLPYMGGDPGLIHFQTAIATLTAKPSEPITQYDRLMAGMTVEKMANWNVRYDSDSKEWVTHNGIFPLTKIDDALAAEIEWLKKEVTP